MKSVILVNFGGPRQIGELRDFLKDIFCDVLPGPLKKTASMFSALRVPASQRLYDEIGGSSPVVSWTLIQAGLLESRLKKLLGEGYKCYAAMLYGLPKVLSVIEQARRDGAESVLLLPLFPYSYGTIRNFGEKTILAKWPLHSIYINMMVDIIKSSLSKLKGHDPTQTHILFSAHAIPMSYVRKGSGYLEEIFSSVNRIMQEFIGYNFDVSFQSAVLPINWSKPSTKNTIKRLASQKVKNMVIVPLGFACENLETLYEIDKCYIPYAQKEGIPNVVRAPAINDHPMFIELLAELVINDV